MFARIPKAGVRLSGKVFYSEAKLPKVFNRFNLFPGTFPHGNPSWNVDLRRLRREYLLLQSLSHPDTTSAGSTPKKDEEHSRKLNEAFNIIQNPVTRSQHLLELHGFDTSEKGLSAIGKNSELLATVMDVHEQLEKVEKWQEVKKILGENKRRMQETIKVLGAAFEKNDLEAAMQKSIELNYWAKLEKAMKEWTPGSKVKLD
ncbi:HGL091Cp [Eremothecium sinecaudum]|uniref:HGL091Cp n=1 Tax=Eremothecium sinecaudum TaxID=45286 RepID=A0A0X8HVH6_9SACH|nr:HGL091Cp [Eremothecium sinecaudum]AMD22249.1 HGL091Cp [Eremothecium sinecaudum]